MHEKFSFNADYLVCPKCRLNLLFDNSCKQLVCPGCGNTIKYIDGIYFVDTIVNIEKCKQTIEEFGKRWNKVYKKLGGITHFLFPMIEPVKKEFFKDKIVLDAGGGFGRLTKILLDSGARHVFILDASSSVFAAVDYLSEYADRVTIVRGDLLNPPFKLNSFDVVFCHGVLHHTGDGRRGIMEMSKLLKQDTGSMILWVYSREGNLLLRHIVDLVRIATLRMGNRGRWAAVVPIDIVLWLITHGIYIPLNKIFKIKNKLWYGEYFIDFLFDSKINNKMDRMQMYHDFITTGIITYYSKQQLNQWFEEAKYKTINYFFYRKQSWAVSASYNLKEDFLGKNIKE